MSRLFGSDAGLSLDATVKYKSADYGKAVNNYVFALVPPQFFTQVANAAGTPPLAKIKAIAEKRSGRLSKDGEVSVLAQLTPSGWSFVQAELIAYSQSVANAQGGAVNILNTVDASQIPGGRFCIGYGESSGSMLTFEALREVLLLPGASSNLSGVPCVLTGMYMDGPASSRAGSSVTFKASVVGLGPTGTVQFTDGAVALGAQATLGAANQAVSNGAVSTSSLALGVHSIGAAYGGDAKNAAVRAEIPLVHEVVAAPPGGSSTSLSGEASSDMGSQVVFSVSVAGDAPTGSVQFKDGAVNLGDAVPLVGGVATLRVSTLALGSHSITAAYSGNSTNAPSTSNVLTHAVYAAITTQVSITSSVNPATSSQSVTFTATVSGNNPTGSVTFRDGGTTLSQVALANGVASYTVGSLAPGAHLLTAQYSGDGNNQTVTSLPIYQLVSAPQAPSGSLVIRYRLYSPGTFEHLYTTDFNEYSVLPACCAWQAEGAIYKVFNGPASFGGVPGVPYYRLYNPFSFQHHWTTDANENNVLPTVGWRQEGIDGYILPSAVSGAIPLYRLYLNAQGGLHLWTTDANERNVLVATAGWVDEGIAGYVVPLP